MESCGPLQCSAAVFNAYTPGGWDFRTADEWHAATSEVYNVGPVSEAQAIQAAKEGRPNPLSDEQFSEGLRQHSNESSFYAEEHLTMWIRMWLPYHWLFDRLGWDPAEIGLGNFEPRYLEALVAFHDEEVGLEYDNFLFEYNQDPEAFMDKLNPWGYGSGR